MNRTGNQNPTFRSCADYEKTEGGYAAELSESYSLKLHPWQELVLRDWLAVDSSGKLLHSFCLLEAPRQQGKTGCSDSRETWGLLKRKESILHTAQEFQTAKKAFDRLRKKFGAKRGDPYAAYPELNALVERYSVSAGQMVLDLTNGAHIEFRTRGNNADMGRGGTFDLVVIDEAQTYTEEQDAALSPLNSAAPTGSPQTILMGTPPLMAGGAKGLVFARSIDRIRAARSEGDCAHLWAVDEIGDIHDRNRWYFVNPSLGYQLLEEAIARDATKMSEDMFAREHLGYIAKSPTEVMQYAISEKLWDHCASDELKPEGKTAYGIKFSADGAAVCLCGAVIPPDGPARISLIRQELTGAGLAWLSSWLNERYKIASCVVIDGRGNADVLIDRLRPSGGGSWVLKDSVIKPSAQNVAAAAEGLLNDLREERVTWYRPQGELRESALSATKRPMRSGGWAFGGDYSTPIEAAALALWGCRNTRRNPQRKMRLG